jgi:sensor histidine kinase YesM
MKNPITQSVRNIFIYAASWFLILIVHIGTLYFLYDLNLAKSIIDGLVFDTVFAFLGLALWYPVFYNDIEKYSFTVLIINHISIMALTLAFWISSCIFILKTIFPEPDTYILLLENGIAWRVFTGTFFYFSIIMIYYLLIYAYNLREHILQESRLREKVNEAELQTLKSQINPHFLFNSLNSISSLTLTNPEKAHEMIIKLSGFLRYSLAHDPNNLIPLKQEIENMEAYVAVEKVRFGDKLIFEKNISDKCCDHKVPFLILQPLIENAIKHGVYESMEPVTVKVSCRETEEKQVEIIVENDFDPLTIPRKGTGTGLKNIKERLKIIYQLNDLLTFEKTESYFKVILVLPNQPVFKTQIN